MRFDVVAVVMEELEPERRGEDGGESEKMSSWRTAPEGDSGGEGGGLGNCCGGGGGSGVVVDILVGISLRFVVSR